MMPKEWRLAATAADRLVDSVQSRGRGRICAVRQDFLLDPEDRLSEQERALMANMFHNLLSTLANEIALAAGIREYEADPVELAAKIRRAGVADFPKLITLMLRRAHEFRASNSFAVRDYSRSGMLITRMIGDNDAAIASSAMALVIARGGRMDGFGQPRVELNDLDGADAYALAQSVAALIAREPAGDAGFATAAALVADNVEPSKSLESITDDFVSALEAGKRDDDGFIELASSQRELAIIVVLLARRSGISRDVVWDHVTGAAIGSLGAILSMAGLTRGVAARVIAELCADLDPATSEREMAVFDGLDEKEAAELRSYWRLPPEYRSAQEAFRG
jgi:hypothetical protein